MDDDPILQKRRRIAALVSVGKRLGYACFALAVVFFVIGGLVGFATMGPATIAAMVVGSIVLAPAIVFGYGVRAAERDDSNAGRNSG